MELLSRPWPWYVAGPLIGLFVPVLLLAGNRLFGVSANLRHLCAALAPRRIEYFRYAWRAEGGWNLAFLAGITAGGFVAVYGLGVPDVAISPETRAALQALGIQDFSGLVPRDIIGWSSLLSLKGFLDHRGWRIPRRVRHGLRRRLHVGPRDCRPRRPAASFAHRGDRILCRRARRDLLDSPAARVNLDAIACDPLAT